MSTNKKSLHVAAFAFPFASHPTSLLHLVRLLAAAAPNVQFSYFNTKTSNQNLSSKLNLINNHDHNIKMYDVWDGAPEGRVFSGNPMEAIELFLKATPDNYRKRLNQVVEEIGVKATCFLTDAFLWFAVEMAEEMGVPWVALWTAGPTSISLHMYTDVIASRIGGNSESTNVDETLDFLPGMSAIHASDLPIEFTHLTNPFSQLLYNMSQAIPKSSAVVLNSFAGIHSAVETDLKSKLQNLLNMGPFPALQLQIMPPYNHKNDSLSWLNRQKPASVAYLSFGTMLTPPPPELVALSEALEEKQIPYLWTFKDYSKTEILKGFFERTRTLGKVVEWAPQLEVLAHSSVGVLVTHCGWNSVIESISCGVPMICRPFFGDQMINRRLVEEVWRIGVGVGGGVFGKSEMMNALELVLVKEDGKNLRENVGRMKECGFKAIGEGGSSFEDFKSLVGIVTSR